MSRQGDNLVAGVVNGKLIVFQLRTSAIISNFLSDAFVQRAYRTLDVTGYRSAISTALLPPSGGQPLEQHPHVCQVMWGEFHRHPPQPRYSASWDVPGVLSNIQRPGPSDEQSVKDLSWKLVLLLALTLAPRVGELQGLECRHMQHLIPAAFYSAC